MKRLFLGKFSTKYPEQIEKKYYAAGEEGSSWYGDVKVGDYVFIGYGGKIVALWRAKQYTTMKNQVNPTDDHVLQFEEIKTYKDVSITNDFGRYKHFKQDLNLVNKLAKSVRGLGFIPITVDEKCPSAEEINFKGNTINIYIALEGANVQYKEGDIRVHINNLEEMKIEEIERFTGDTFEIYEELDALYRTRNQQEGYYSIKELNVYALQDHASKKRKFLTNLIEELQERGYCKVPTLVKLYDNVLVGRKKTKSNKVVDNSNKDNSSLIEEDDIEVEEILAQHEKLANLLNFNPNMILYGPPGTGKTYATKQIIEAFERKYVGVKGGYEVALQENRIKNITFHQAYSYEEFIEGIRPVLSDTDQGKVGYKIENGIFKEHCINAEKELIRNKENSQYINRINADSTIWKVSLGERKNEDLYNKCIKQHEIAIGWLEDEDLSNYSYDDIYNELSKSSEKKPTNDASSVNALVNEMNCGDVVLIYDGPETIRKIGIIKSDYIYKQGQSYAHRREVEWVEGLEYPINILKYNKKILTLKTIYALNRMSVSDIIEIITTCTKNRMVIGDKEEIRPYYMVIDEINRGNISKIFGELITLIEQDKRGRLKATLPYSKKEFTVPDNLYIIGTMNTADRSIAVIDTALRRRFTFVEIEPDETVISETCNAIINDQVDLTKLMKALNEKIMKKYDRDHRIGHAYFMGIDNLKDLYQTWYYKILPLLGEYFYNDITTLRNIVGKDFYDDYGNIIYLDMNSVENTASEFEINIKKIYEEQSNGGE